MPPVNTESQMPRDKFGAAVPAMRPGTTQKASYSGTSAAISNAVAAGTVLIRVVATTDCHLAFGSAPTATANGPLLPAKTVEYFRVAAGDKVAAIRASESGDLFVTEMA